MADQNTPEKTIVVAGDVTIDWNLMANPESSSGDNRNFTRICNQPGGVLLIANLVEQLEITRGTAVAPGDRMHGNAKKHRAHLLDLL